MPARVIQTNTTPFKKVDVDPITLDIIENAMRNARTEMDAVLFRTAMSPGIREQHDAFPMIANAEGKMVVGQFGSFFWGFQQGYDGTIEEGDVFPDQRSLLLQRRDQPSERLADHDADLQGRPDRRLGRHVRPYDGYRPARCRAACRPMRRRFSRKASRSRRSRSTGRAS